jgi:hypothetical protein
MPEGPSIVILKEAVQAFNTTRKCLPQLLKSTTFRPGIREVHKLLKSNARKISLGGPLPLLRTFLVTLKLCYS